MEELIQKLETLMANNRKSFNETGFTFYFGESTMQMVEKLIKWSKEIEEQRDSLMWQRNTIDIPKIKVLEKDNKSLREYINFAPNLDEMSSLEFKNIQEQSYLRGRNDENINYKNYVENNYIEKSKVLEELDDIIDYFEFANATDEDIEFLQEKKNKLLQKGE